MKALGLAAVTLAAALAGCGAAPFDYHPAGDIRPGPGLFTGEKGAFVFTPAKPAPVAASSESEAQEFERWKRSAEGSAEYREFQDWREWREWKRRNAQ
jgi:hypothetical protein